VLGATGPRRPLWYTPCPRDVPLPARGVEDEAALGPAAAVVGDRDGEVWYLMREVIRAVERVEDPEVLSGDVAGLRLLAADVVAGEGREDCCGDDPLGVEIGVGDQVGDVLGPYLNTLVEVAVEARRRWRGRTARRRSIGGMDRGDNRVGR
jgi:hypothetical protein